MSVTKVQFTNSIKDIPISSKDAFQRKLISQSESFFNRLHWIALFKIDNPNLGPNEQKQNYGFKSKHRAPRSKTITPFENAWWKTIKNMKFKEVDVASKCIFQKNLQKEVRALTSDDKHIIKGDKSGSLYKIDQKDYKILMKKEIQKFYKKANSDIVDSINNDVHRFSTELGINDRVSKFVPNLAFCTIKDHKDHWEQLMPIRLINPSKTDLGRMSKHILDKILKFLRENNPKLNQFKSTDNALNWFRTIPNVKGILTYDIKDFYPSITREILEKSLDFAASQYSLEGNDREIIVSARKSVLFFENSPWVKKVDSTFDVTMGCPDGAEVAELVGLYLLSRLESMNIIDPAMNGLYRDDGIIVLNNANRSGQKFRENLFDFFKDEGFTIKTSPVCDFIDFLDIRLHIDKTHEVFTKPTANIRYVNVKSNHPKVVLKNISKNTEHRIRKLCSTESIFDKHAPFFNKILENSGHDHDLKYAKIDPIPNEKRKNRYRKRKVTWFNPPFCKSVRTKLGQEFFRLLEIYFPEEHPHRGLFNKNTIKLSYCTMGNVKSIVACHNAKQQKLAEKMAEKPPAIAPKPPKTCNCKKGEKCPVGGKCLTSSVVYEASIIHTSGRRVGSTHTYVGLTCNEFKVRYRAHMRTFRNKDSTGHTKLSEYVHKLKAKGIKHRVEWRILEEAAAFDGVRCRLCLAEKTRILFSTAKNPLNQRTELLYKCRHMKRYELATTQPTRANTPKSGGASQARKARQNAKK